MVTDSKTKPSWPDPKKQWWPEITDIESARKIARYAFWAALFSGSLTALFGIYQWAGYDRWALVDAALVYLLGFGVSRMSRTSAILLLVYFVGSKIWTTYQYQNFQGNVIVFLSFVAMFTNGVRATYGYHRIAKQEGIPTQQFLNWAILGKWVIFVTLGLLVVFSGLYGEFKLHNTVLGRPTYKWASLALRDQRYISPSKDWEVSFKNTSLDWRRFYWSNLKGFDGVAAFQGFPGGLLSIFESNDTHQDMDDKTFLGTSILGLKKDPTTSHVVSSFKVPDAIGGLMIVYNDGSKNMSDKTAVVLFRNKKKFIVLKFLTYQPINGAPAAEADILNDFLEISRSFNFN